MIALAVVAAQYAGTFDATVTGRVDARVNQPATVVSVDGRNEQIAIASDAPFSATALLRMHDRHWEFSLSYSPSILVPDLELQVDRNVNPSDSPLILNTGGLTARWHDRFSWVSFTESDSYGMVTTAVPYTGPPATTMASPPGMTTTTPPGMGMTTPPGMTTTAPGQTTILPQEQLQYGSSSTGLAIGTKLGRRTVVTLTGTYALSGALEQDQTAVIPYIAGPTAAVAIATHVSPSETLTTTANGNDNYMDGTCPIDLFPPSVQQAAPVGTVQMPCKTRNDTFQIEEGYRRQLGKLSTASATVGAAAVRGPSLNGVDTLAIVPVFAFNYIQALYTYWPGTLTVAVNIAPTVDLLTSVVNDQATATATLATRATKKVGVAFTLTATQSLPIPSSLSPITGFGGTVEAKFKVNKQADVILGNMEYWQQQGYSAGVGAPSQSLAAFTALAYVGVTLRAPTLHF